jgi:hypothetical protein
MGSVNIPPAARVPDPPDAADQAINNARTMERRKQLGLQGRLTTFLTTAQGDKGSSSAGAPQVAKTLLGQ